MNGGRARRIALAVWLTVFWVAAWGDVSLGTALAGALVGSAVALLVRGGTDEPRSTARPLAVAVFAVWFVGKLIQSTAEVAWEVVTPRNRIREGVVAVPIRGVSATITTIVANAISLTPGTLTLEVRERDDAVVLYVHVLHLDEPEHVRRDVLHLEALAIRAFGASEALAALAAEPPHNRHEVTGGRS